MKKKLAVFTLALGLVLALPGDSGKDEEYAYGCAEEEEVTVRSKIYMTAAGKNTENKDSVKKADEKENAKKEEAKLPEYTVSAFESPQAMYASSAVNVRKGPSTAFDRVGGLSRGQEVTATGQAVTEVKNVSGVILVGDSRFVQMQANVGENSCTWIAESGKGYNWFNENAIARIDGCVGKGSKILINLGVNDPGNLNNYLALVNAKAAEWVGKGAAVYYASVNPVWENPYVTEEQVEYFNSQMQSGLSGDVHWIDSHSYLNTIGYKLVDGLHYNAETYQNLYAYYMSCF